MSIGETLAAARASGRALPSTQVAAATRIRRTLIQAIEHDDYSRLRRRLLRPRPHPHASPRTVGARPGAAARASSTRRTAAAARRRGATEVFEPRPRPGRSAARPNWTRRDGRRARRWSSVYGVVPGVRRRRRPRHDDRRRRQPSAPAPAAAPHAGAPTPSGRRAARSPQAPRDRVTVTCCAPRDRSWVQVTTGERPGAVPGHCCSAARVKTFTDKQPAQAGHRQRRRRRRSPSTAPTSGSRAAAGRSPGVQFTPAGPRGRLTAGSASAGQAAPPSTARHVPDRPARRAGHPRLRPQRGRLRGARRPARRRRLGAGRRRRPTPTSSLVNTCGFVEAAKKDSIDTLLGRRRHAGAEGGRGRLPGRAVRRRAGRGAARGRRGARLRRLRRHRRPARRTIARRRARTRRTPRATGARCCRSPRRPRQPRPRAATRRHGSTCPTASAPASGPRRCDAGSTTARSRRSSSPPAATGAARSARSRPSAARSSPGRRTTCSPRRAGWPSRACASSSWSARTPRPTARTSATCGCSRRCCPSSPRSTGIERVRVSLPAAGRDCGPALVEAIATTPGVAPYFDLSFQHASRAGAAPDAPVRRHRRASSSCSSRSARAAPEAGVRTNVIVGFPGETEADLAELERFLTRPGSTRSACSATPTRTAPRRPAFDGKLDADDDRARGSSGSPRWPRS